MIARRRRTLSTPSVVSLIDGMDAISLAVSPCRWRSQKIVRFFSWSFPGRNQSENLVDLFELKTLAHHVKAVGAGAFSRSTLDWFR